MNRDEMLKYLVANLHKWPSAFGDLLNVSKCGGWGWIATDSGLALVYEDQRPINSTDWVEAKTKADARMNNIVRNGNDGDHYEDQSVENSSDVAVQEINLPNEPLRYKAGRDSIHVIGANTFQQSPNDKQNDGGDLIDRWAIKYTRTEFRAVMRAQVEKYYDRYGDKDSFVSESRKAADYALRLHEYEVKWAAEDNEVVSDD